MVSEGRGVVLSRTPWMEQASCIRDAIVCLVFVQPGLIRRSFSLQMIFSKHLLCHTVTPDAPHKSTLRRAESTHLILPGSADVSSARIADARGFYRSTPPGFQEDEQACAGRSRFKTA